MNLTKCFVAGLCATAMTASAVELKANAFEDGEPGTGWSFDGVKDWDTTGVRVDGDASLEGYTAARPMTGVTSNKVLKLDTEGGVWTNTVVDGSFVTAPVWADMLVKFVPSEELPVLDAAVKLAIAVTNGSLVVSKMNEMEDGNTWSSTTTAIDTSLWYRVTVKLETGESSFNASVTINGNQIVSVGGETLFGIFDSSYEGVLNSIGFQGTGFVDEVAVRDDDPFAPTETLFAGTGEPVDPVEYSAWLGANNMDAGDVAEAMYDAFLMNVAPDGSGSPDLKVSSITVDGNIVLTLAADYAEDDDVAIDPESLNNGVAIEVLGKASLSDSDWEKLGSSLNFSPVEGQITYQFFKVEIAAPVAL